MPERSDGANDATRATNKQMPDKSLVIIIIINIQCTRPYHEESMPIKKA